MARKKAPGLAKRTGTLHIDKQIGEGASAKALERVNSKMQSGSSYD